jgi:hypothetical protein
MNVKNYREKNDLRHVKIPNVHQILMTIDVLLYQMFFVNEMDVL